MQRTARQEANRRRMTAQRPPPGWRRLACRRHPDTPLVLTVEARPYCYLCMRALDRSDVVRRSAEQT